MGTAKAMIQDNTRCIGCRACMVACKEWNDLGADESQFFAGEGYQNPRDLDAKNYNIITYSEEPEDAQWVFGRKLCMHCDEPACVSACPTGALQKLASGAVDLIEWRCIGCRYCMQACPFVIPKFNFDSPVPKINKCTFCSDRLEANLEPACVKVCPTHAIEFGDHADMLAEAKRRIADSPGTYIPHVYGEKEAGGTSVFHLSGVDFAKLGYEMGLPDEPLPDLTHKSMRFVPKIFFALLGVFGLLAWVTRRRAQRLGLDEH